MLAPSLPLSRYLDLPICLARFPAARLWPKDESLEDSANLSRFRSRFPGFPRHAQGFGASRRKAGGRRTRCQRSIPMLSPPKLIRSFPLAHPTGFRSMLSIPTNAIVEDRRLAEFGEIPCFNVELTFEQALSLRAHLHGSFLE